MRRVLIRAGYALAPVVLLGTIALIEGPGRHRVAILALAVVIAVVLGVSAGEADSRATDSERSVSLPAQSKDQETTVPLER